VPQTVELSPDWLSAAQVSDLLGISIHTVNRWRDRKVGPRYVKLSATCVRYHRDDIEQYVRERMVGTRDQKAPLARH
jgi:predicted DNA-binding transcriptional regulator AlpA